MEKEDNPRPNIKSDLAKKTLTIDGELLNLDNSLTYAGINPDNPDLHLLKYRAQNSYEYALSFAVEESEDIYSLLSGLGYENCDVCPASSEEPPYIPEISIG